MTRITALEIQTNGEDIKCTASEKTTNGKHVGWIELYRNGELHKPLINTEAVYDSKKDAIRAMKEVVREVRKMDLSKS